MDPSVITCTLQQPPTIPSYMQLHHNMTGYPLYYSLRTKIEWEILCPPPFQWKTVALYQDVPPTCLKETMKRKIWFSANLVCHGRKVAVNAEWNINLTIFYRLFQVHWETATRHTWEGGERAVGDPLQHICLIYSSQTCRWFSLNWLHHSQASFTCEWSAKISIFPGLYQTNSPLLLHAKNKK